MQVVSVAILENLAIQEEIDQETLEERLREGRSEYGSSRRSSRRKSSLGAGEESLSSGYLIATTQFESKTTKNPSSYFAYTESIASAWTSVGNSICKLDYMRAGIFFHKSQVEEYLTTLELVFEKELACPYHMEVSNYFSTFL
jgi:hypothetical protein